MAAVERLAAVEELAVHGGDGGISPFVRHHANVLGRYSFLLPEMPGGLRPLRDPERAEA
ncbi:hypothetical protein ACIQU6_38640 [Streptomyces sp. NPDC090442]|uniref:hypothetical protein n=1 Tax=Streptomyces sp. NPDC090442 TaxID=3365962 RepID=UPI00380C7D18